jgi:hypothetical protein
MMKNPKKVHETEKGWERFDLRIIILQKQTTEKSWNISSKK